MSSRPGRLSPLVLVLLVAAAALVAISYSRMIRRVSLGAEFQYIPRENTLLIGTGDLESLWQAIETHFGRALRLGEGPISELADEYESTVSAWGRDIHDVADLERRGLDVTRGILASLYRTKREGRDKFVMVLPVVDYRLLVETLATQAQVEPEELYLLAGEGSQEGRTVTALGDLLAASPEPGLCVLSNSQDLLRRSLFFRRQNLAHALNNDSLYRALRRRLKRPLFTGASVFLFWQSRSAPFGELAAAFRFEPERFWIDADIDLAGGTFSLIEEALARPPEAAPWQRYLPRETFAAVLLQDRSLPHFLDVLVDSGELEPQSAYPPLEIFRREGTFERLVAAVTDIREGLPDVLLGIWGPRDSLADFTWELRRHFREQRDRFVLEEAISRYADDPPPTVAALEARDLLRPEPGSLFDRYEIRAGEVGEARLRAQDFENETYMRPYGGLRIEFLAPRLTDNDLAYNPELWDADRDVLLNDDYRLASVIFEDVLWIATGARQLEQMIERRHAGGPTLARNANFKRLFASSAGDEKLRLYFDMDRFLEASLLNLESGLGESARESLAELRDHPAARLDVTRAGRGSRLQLTLELIRRTWPD